MYQSESRIERLQLYKSWQIFPNDVRSKHICRDWRCPKNKDQDRSGIEYILYNCTQGSED